jgi:hypothetical protein
VRSLLGWPKRTWRKVSRQVIRRAAARSHTSSPLAGAAATETGVSIWSIIAAVLAPVAEVGAGVLLPDSTASNDTTEDNSNVPVYRVVDPTELAYL